MNSTAGQRLSLKSTISHNMEPWTLVRKSIPTIWIEKEGFKEYMIPDDPMVPQYARGMVINDPVFTWIEVIIPNSNTKQ